LSVDALFKEPLEHARLEPETCGEQHVEADTYGKQLSLSDALFQKPVELKVTVGQRDAERRVANPQEADRETQPEGRLIVRLEDTEGRDQWLEKGMPESPRAVRCIPPGFTPPQVDSPTDSAQARGFSRYPPGLTPPQAESFTCATHTYPPDSGATSSSQHSSCPPSKNDIMLPTMIPETATEFPSVGSSLHGTGQCKPCAWFHKPGGCLRGKQCRHCHTCASNEVAQRKKEKVAALKAQAKGEAMFRKQQMMYLQASKMMSAASQLLPSHQTPKPLRLSLLVA